MESVKNVRVRVGGMSCVNCQNRIEKRVRKLRGVRSVSVNFGEGIAVVSYDAGVVSFEKISEAIEKLGYRVLSGGEAHGLGVRRVFGFLIVIVALYVLLQWTGLLNRLVPNQLADSQMGFGMLFVIGLITSVHCIAMCGGINLSQSIPRGVGAVSSDGSSGGSSGAGSQGKSPSKKTRGKSAGEITRGKATDTSIRFGAFAPAFLYNIGRIITYTAVGFVLGAVGFAIGGGGAEAGLPVMAQGILKLAAGVFMVIMGINMLGLFPALRKLNLRMPRFRASESGSDKPGTARVANKAPLLVGMLNGLMPCGPLQSMQIVALASGSPFVGALSMFLFSLGTVPLMLGLGSVISALGRKFAGAVMSIGAVLVVALGLAMLTQGGTLAGFMPPIQLPTIGGAEVANTNTDTDGNADANANDPDGSADTNANAAAPDGKQHISSTLTLGSYPDITVKSGTPVKWTIDASIENINGCNGTMIIPEYEIQHTFEPGENTIEFTPSEAGRYGYSCWMGMIRGTITVV